MKRHIILLVIIAMLYCVVGTAQAFEVNFAQNKSNDLFADMKGPEIINGQLLLSGQIETQVLPVAPGKKYKLEIEARVESDLVVEANDRAHIHVLKSHLYRPASTYDILFQDAAGESVTPYRSMRGFFLTRELTSYTFVFHAPNDATALKVLFRPNSAKTYITKLRLVEETEEHTVNPNPDFRYGELSYSGWQPQREGRLYTRPDGKTVLHVGYNGSSPYFPVSPEKKYRLSAIGEGGRMTLRYIDANGKNLVNRPLGNVTLEGIEKEIVPPEGTVAARVTMLGSLILEEFKVVELK